MRPFVLVRDAFVVSAITLSVLAWKNVLSWWWLPAISLVYLITLVLGAANIRWNFFIPSYNHGPRTGNNIALSFDDGPAAHTEDILDILALEGVTAAFFTIGSRAAAAPDVVRRWSGEGHVIGNHSYNHSRNFDWKGRNAMVAEILQTNETVKSITGVTPRLFRPPYGVTNPELSHAVVLTSMKSVGWSLRSLDTRAASADKLLQRILSRVRGGDIILLHDSGPYTAAILTALIRGCREKGFTFVPVDELLGLEAYA